MKKIKYFVLGLCLLFPAINYAQGKEQRDSARKAHMEELKKTRQDLFISKLGLSESEAKNFFPIYDEYQLKLRDSRKEFRKKWKDKKPSDLTESEAEQYLTDAIKLRETEVSLFSEYSNKLKTVIPAKKIILLPKVEREVQKELIAKFKDKRKHKEPGDGPGRGRPHGHGPGGPPPPPPLDDRE